MLLCIEWKKKGELGMELQRIQKNAKQYSKS